MHTNEVLSEVTWIIDNPRRTKNCVLCRGDLNNCICYPNNTVLIVVFFLLFDIGSVAPLLFPKPQYHNSPSYFFDERGHRAELLVNEPTTETRKLPFSTFLHPLVG